MKFIIREEVPKDIDSINTITIDAFQHAEHTGHNEHLIVCALRAGDALTISMVAEIDDKIVGHIAISPISISSGECNWYGLGPISVSPHYQGNGIGSSLITHALNRLKSEYNANGCVVLGEPSYYARFGFRVHKELTLEGVPAEYFQALTFTTLPLSGLVTYHKAFDS